MGNETEVLRGSCLCGAIRYEIRGVPLMMYYCHCSTCRKATGSAFATNMLVQSADFVVVAGRELLSAYESSPNKHRHFCSACGSPIYSQAEATKQMVSVRCGTLDTELTMRPSVHTYAAEKAEWYEISDELPQTPQGLG